MLSIPGKSHRTRLFAPAATCAVLAAAFGLSLPGCQSPLRPGDNSFSSEAYYQSLIAHEVAGSSNNNFGMGGTYAGTVGQMARVDEPGPATTTSQPSSTQPSIARAALIGLPSAALNTEEPVIGLSLQDAIARTVQHSLAIKVEAYNPGIKEAQLIQAEAAFDATFFGASQWAVNDDPSISPGLGNGQSWQNQVGIKKLLPTGTQIQSTANITYRDINTTGLPNTTVEGLTVNGRNLANSYTAALGVQVVQPLLRGFGRDVNEANIYLAQRDQRISQAQFKAQVIKTVADVEDAYQNLILQRTNVEVLERLVVSSEQTYNLIVQRAPLDATKASINQALSALEQRRASLHVAQKDYRNASDKLKSLMNDPSLDINGNALINPTDQPIQEPFAYNVPECIRTALMQRPEMQQARLQIERADIVLRVAKNDLLPKLDLTVSAQANGLTDGFDTAFSSTVDPANSIDFGAGIKFEIPIGNRAALGENVQRKLERRQAIDNMVQISQQILLDVKTQLREVLSSYAEIQIRDKVRRAAALYFEGIIEIEDIRPRTPEFLNLKLDSQQQLATAEQQLIQAIVNYNLAIMRLEQAKGTLLEFDQVSLDRAPRAKDDDGLSSLRIMGKKIGDIGY